MREWDVRDGVYWSKKKGFVCVCVWGLVKRGLSTHTQICASSSPPAAPGDPAQGPTPGETPSAPDKQPTTRETCPRSNRAKAGATYPYPGGEVGVLHECGKHGADQAPPYMEFWRSPVLEGKDQNQNHSDTDTVSFRCDVIPGSWPNQRTLGSLFLHGEMASGT